MEFPSKSVRLYSTPRQIALLEASVILNALKDLLR